MTQTPTPRREPRTKAAETLMRRLAELDTVPVEWAPAHSAPYVSKFIVEPIVEMGLREVESEAVRQALSELEEEVGKLRVVSVFVPSGDYVEGYVKSDIRAVIELIHKKGADL